MKLLDLTLPTPVENVALDEALLDAAEAEELKDEVLRLWESPSPAVIVGRSSRVAEEVDLAECSKAGIPVLRRASGGAAVVIGPGCLMYGVLLRYAGREHLRLLDEVHRHVIEVVRSAVGRLVAGVVHEGTCDLTVAGRKFCGNSVRCKRDHLLYHGTLLYDFDLSLIERLLRMPPRHPQYRAGRPHRDFVTNIAASAADARGAIAATFRAHQPLAEWPLQRTAQLVATRYSQEDWTYKR
jgi:lipoate-protein ligase A